MTDASNSNQHSDQHKSSQQQSEDGESSALGRSYGLSGVDDEHNEDRTTGSAAGDMSQNQQSQGMPNADDGMASDAMGSGSGSDMMDLDEDEDDETETDMDDDDVDNTGMTGQR